MSRTKTLELAMEKAAALPNAAQEQIGREMLEHIQTLAELRSQIEIGIQQLDAGRGEELNIDDVMKEARGNFAAALAGEDKEAKPQAPNHDIGQMGLWHFLALD
jgi:hypothetical protein